MFAEEHDKGRLKLANEQFSAETEMETKFARGAEKDASQTIDLALRFAMHAFVHDRLDATTETDNASSCDWTFELTPARHVRVEAEIPFSDDTLKFSKLAFDADR